MQHHHHMSPVESAVFALIIVICGVLSFVLPRGTRAGWMRRDSPGGDAASVGAARVARKREDLRERLAREQAERNAGEVERTVVLESANAAISRRSEEWQVVETLAGGAAVADPEALRRDLRQLFVDAAAAGKGDRFAELAEMVAARSRPPAMPEEPPSLRRSTGRKRPAKGAIRRGAVDGARPERRVRPRLTAMAALDPRPVTAALDARPPARPLPVMGTLSA